MKYLVLGSAGQIGFPLCKFLRKKGHEVSEFDIAANEQHDLRTNKALLTSQVDSSDFVFFLAFDVGGSRYLKAYQHTYEFISNNVKIMDTTFDVLRNCRKPFIFASSQMANMSYSSYGVLKALGDFYTRILNGLVVKFWNVYGIEYDSQKFHAITDFIIKAKSEGFIRLLTTGEETRQLLYVEDCCEALFLLSEAAPYQAISREANLHITSFEWHKIIDVARVVGRELGVSVIPGKDEDSVQRFQRNEPDPGILHYWKPKTSLENGIRKVINGMNGRA
jgi:nucleoside-diphosphate-sugar epimerase